MHKEYVEFWMRVLNPMAMPIIPKKEFITFLEKLARGSTTETNTLVSIKFCKGFYCMLDKR